MCRNGSPRRFLLLSLAVVGFACESRLVPPTTPPFNVATFLRAVPSSSLIVFGRIQAPTALDQHGRTGQLLVDRVLRGNAATGKRVAIAWEELSPDRPPRFREAEQIVVALEPLPSGSLWQTRFANQQPAPWVIAGKGDAYIYAPDEHALRSLTPYAALQPPECDGARGTEVLIELVRDAPPVYANAAIAMMTDTPTFALSREAAAALSALLSDTQRPLDLRRGLLNLIARQRLIQFSDVVEALTTVPALQADALGTLARLDYKMTDERLLTLLHSPLATVRAAALGMVGSAATLDRCRELAISDPDATVRNAAIKPLSLQEDHAIGDLMPLLHDSNADVRRSAAMALARQGQPAVEPLQKRIVLASGDEAAATVLALNQLGQAGAAVLRLVAASHGDPKVKRLAKLALGHPDAE